MAYWIETGLPAKLAIMPRPNGGKHLESAIRNLKREGANVLVSLLPPDEAFDLGLEHERAACDGHGILFRNFPIPDRGIPRSTEAFLDFLETLHQDLIKEPQHRRPTASRALADPPSCSLPLLRREGLSTDDAFRRITQGPQRPRPPTPPSNSTG